MKKLSDDACLSRSLWYLLVLTVLSMGVVLGCDRGPNTVVVYLQGAERQSEDLDQRREIEKALNDMLTLSPDELRTRRYANYQMEPRAWDVIELLHRYFVPQQPAGLNEARFYKDVTKPEAKAVIQEHLKAVKEAIALDEKESEPDAEE